MIGRFVRYVVGIGFAVAIFEVSDRLWPSLIGSVEVLAVVCAYDITSDSNSEDVPR
jgi:hypothetical protein